MSAERIPMTCNTTVFVIINAAPGTGGDAKAASVVTKL